MTPSVEEIRAWLVARVSHLTAVPPAEVDVRVPLTRYGLDSVALIALAADLEQWLGCQFRENLLADQPAIESLARLVAEQIGKSRSAES
jgi:acyl carrier protein